MKKIAVFLGNPGKQYEKTRHNAGFMIAACLSEKLSLRWKEKAGAMVAVYGDNIFVMPQSYMNLSGSSVQSLAHFYGVKPEEIVVVHDDLETPFGEIKSQTGGGLAGHNGLRSIAKDLSSTEFKRIRFGISRPERETVSAYVLSRFSPEEEKKLPQLIQRAAETVISML